MSQFFSQLNQTIFTPTFNGQPVFGDPTKFKSLRFNGTLLDADAFLGLTPGTTIYNPSIGGGSWEVTGVLTGQTQSLVEAAQATLQALAGITAAFGRPTGNRFPSGFEYYQGCWFPSQNLVLGDISNVWTNYWTCPFTLLLLMLKGIPTPT